jgi:hypothetical protein
MQNQGGWSMGPRYGQMGNMQPQYGGYSGNNFSSMRGSGYRPFGSSSFGGRGGTGRGGGMGRGGGGGGSDAGRKLAESTKTEPAVTPGTSTKTAEAELPVKTEAPAAGSSGTANSDAAGTTSVKTEVGHLRKKHQCFGSPLNSADPDQALRQKLNRIKELPYVANIIQKIREILFLKLNSIVIYH